MNKRIQKLLNCFKNEFKKSHSFESKLEKIKESTKIAYFKKINPIKTIEFYIGKINKKINEISTLKEENFNKKRFFKQLSKYFNKYRCKNCQL